MTFLTHTATGICLYASFEYFNSRKDLPQVKYALPACLAGAWVPDLVSASMLFQSLGFEWMNVFLKIGHSIRLGHALNSVFLWGLAMLVVAIFSRRTTWPVLFTVSGFLHVTIDLCSHGLGSDRFHFFWPLPTWFGLAIQNRIAFFTGGYHHTAVWKSGFAELVPSTFVEAMVFAVFILSAVFLRYKRVLEE